MTFLLTLLALLAVCVAVGVVRKLRGGTFLPQFRQDEEHVISDKNGRWWRWDPQARSWEDVFRRRGKGQRR